MIDHEDDKLKEVYMNSEKILQKIDVLHENEAFQSKFSRVETPTVAVRVLAEFGIEITEQELMQLSMNVCREGQLEGNELENVSGGSLLGWLIRSIAAKRYSSGGGGFSFGGGGGGAFGGGSGGGIR